MANIRLRGKFNQNCSTNPTILASLHCITDKYQLLNFRLVPRAVVVSVLLGIFVPLPTGPAFPKINAVRRRTKSGTNVQMDVSQRVKIAVQYAHKYEFEYILRMF